MNWKRGQDHDGLLEKGTEPTVLWIVGQIREGAQWEFQGVFSTEERAVAACRTEDYFVARVGLDAELPHETSEWTVADSWYPLAEPRPA